MKIDGFGDSARYSVQSAGHAVSQTSDSMKMYVATTGVLFGLLTLAHLLRIVDEWPRFATDPWYILLTIVTAVLSVWAWRLLRM